MYSLRDLVLFNTEGWFGLYQTVNTEYWPLHIFGIIWFGFTAYVFFLKKPNLLAIAIAGAAGLWFGSAMVFHFGEYQQLSWVATYYGWAFIAEAVMLLCVALFWRHSLSETLNAQNKLCTINIGYFLVIAGFVLVPFLGLLESRHWSSLDFIGIGPDSTALVTSGIVLVSIRNRVLRFTLCIIPTMWLIVAAATAWPMGLLQGVVSLFLWLFVIFWLLVFNRNSP